MNREELYLKIAELHLKRVEVLQMVEWRLTLSIWTFVAGVAMVSLANADKVKQATVAMGSFLSRLSYYFWSVLFMGCSGTRIPSDFARRITTVS